MSISNDAGGGSGTAAMSATTVDATKLQPGQAPTADTQPVGPQDKAVIATYPSLDAAQAAVERLAGAGFPVERISIIGQGLSSETRVHGFVTAGDVAKSSAGVGAWVGGLCGVLTGVAALFIPGVGPLVVLGPLAAGAVGAAEYAAVGAGVGALLGHFVAKDRIPRYEQVVTAGGYLLVVHGGEQDVTRAQELLNQGGEGGGGEGGGDAGGADVERHDTHRAGTQPG